ncbi:MAG: hypothetical protein HQ596_01870 [Candidatus Saganbacteria bacterium]|nr:hypothetical protein [Candidatus Saganbacteria bacterium]
MPYQKDVVLSRLDWLIECARTLRESFEGKNGYVNDISFLDRVEWDRFKERCSFNSGET